MVGFFAISIFFTSSLSNEMGVCPLGHGAGLGLVFGAGLVEDGVSNILCSCCLVIFF